MTGFLAFLSAALIVLRIILLLNKWTAPNQNDAYQNFSPTEEKTAVKICPFCRKEIKEKQVVFCPYCGEKIQEEEKKIQENKIAFEKTHQNLSDIFNDESIMNKAKEIRRFYGKDAYFRFLQNEAKELGLGDIEINENVLE
jgi:predicted RNA-binding Zn-ribbon protein involved in translation (DUF1610 family)